MIDIFAADEQSDLDIDLSRWSELVRSALTDEGVRGPAEVSLIFANEVAMTELNEKFMGRSGPTDVLSFPIDDEPTPTGRNPDAGGTGPGDPPELEIPQLVGDIVICPIVASRNAVEHERSVDDEIALLAVHGVLHLLGWDHAVDAEADKMETRERELLARHYRAVNS